jgi:hypothetical protein
LNGINTEEMRVVRKAMGAAVALIKHGDRMPPARKEELMGFVRAFLNKNEVSHEDLLAVRDHEITERPDYMNFSKYVATNCKDYNEFAREWRTHFITTMKPKHMPDKWKIDRKTENVWVPTRMRNQVKRA